MKSESLPYHTPFRHFSLQTPLVACQYPQTNKFCLSLDKPFLHFLLCRPFYGSPYKVHLAALLSAPRRSFFLLMFVPAGHRFTGGCGTLRGKIKLCSPCQLWAGLGWTGLRHYFKLSLFSFFSLCRCRGTLLFLLFDNYRSPGICDLLAPRSVRTQWHNPHKGPLSSVRGIKIKIEISTNVNT